jgi:hypothetical protein
MKSIPRDSFNRASAGIDHVLLEATREGHCARRFAVKAFRSAV